MELLMRVARQRRLPWICTASLLLAATAGGLLRYRVAYDIQIRHGDFVVESIPPEDAARRLLETLRSDPVTERRMRAADFLPYFADNTLTTRSLLGALGDPRAEVQATAWESLVRPRGDPRIRRGSCALEHMPTDELLSAFKATSCSEASRELLDELLMRGPEAASTAASHILAGSTDSDSLELVLYCLGAPVSGRGWLAEPVMPVASPRRTVETGLHNPDRATRIRCARLLIMQSGSNLTNDDRAWIEWLTRDEDLLLDVMNSFDGYSGQLRCTRDDGVIEDEFRDTLLGFLNGVARCFGRAPAESFARAGIDSSDTRLDTLCRRWLAHSGEDGTDASPR